MTKGDANRPLHALVLVPLRLAYRFAQSPQIIFGPFRYCLSLNCDCITSHVTSGVRVLREKRSNLAKTSSQISAATDSSERTAHSSSKIELMRSYRRPAPKIVLVRMSALLYSPSIQAILTILAACASRTL